jgi:hypothetical protein
VSGGVSFSALKGTPEAPNMFRRRWQVCWRTMLPSPPSRLDAPPANRSESKPSPWPIPHDAPERFPPIRVDIGFARPPSRGTWTESRGPSLRQIPCDSAPWSWPRTTEVFHPCCAAGLRGGPPNALRGARRVNRTPWPQPGDGFHPRLSAGRGQSVPRTWLMARSAGLTSSSGPAAPAPSPGGASTRARSVQPRP